MTMKAYRNASWILTVCFVWLHFLVNAQEGIRFEQASSFYPHSEDLQQDSIRWGYLSVPENWGSSQFDTIKIAVAVLKNTSGKAKANAVVFIQGGPGAGGIQNIMMWRNHPLRKKNDIVLFDVRGTGFSKPRLCPELGRDLMKIMATNQTEEEDEAEKAKAALVCKQSLLEKGIDINSYHSMSVAHDLNALRGQLAYPQWHVYGVSYGTYMAQVYANAFPEDIKTLVLDSFISDISSYYTNNTTNYMDGLIKVFDMCRADPNCNDAYPALEKVYYQVIAELEESPITVQVDKKVLESGEFTYNAEDFKIAVQQALYHKQLVEVLPLLIYEFQNRNTDALGNLVAAFSALLSMDYGLYYCVSCNEVLPNNSLWQYGQDTALYKGLSGGVAFYQSDFKVCEQWNAGRADSLLMHHPLDKLAEAKYPVLLFYGEYDPITPASNLGGMLAKSKNAHAVKGYTYGHVPSFTKTGFKVATSFINNPSEQPDAEAYKQEGMMRFVGQVKVNAGVSKMGGSLQQMDFMFLAPLLIAVTLILIFIFIYAIKLIRKNSYTKVNKHIRILNVIASAAGLFGLFGIIFAIKDVSEGNFYILAFGLPNEFNFLFITFQLFVGLLILIIFIFLFKINTLTNRSVLFVTIFSNMIIFTYLLYWGMFNNLI